jgi:dihydropyrimidinase
MSADVRIRGETIVEVGPRLAHQGEDEVIDAAGLLVLPGGIDPHVHLGPPTADDFASASRAAIAGGITTIGVMAFPREDEGPLDNVFRQAEAARSQAVVDVMLHPVIPEIRGDTGEQVAALAESGHTSIKVFMVQAGFQRDPAGYLDLLARAGAAGVLTMMHCEDAAILRFALDRLRSQGRTGAEHYAESRPVAAEAAATERAVAMCETTGSPIYLVHVSSERALSAIRAGQDRGLPVFAETRPFFLHLTKDRLEGPDGPLFVSQPPLRAQSDLDALWRGIADGSIQTAGTDHVPWTREQKMEAGLDIGNLRPGAANLQVMLPMLYSEGVRAGRMGVEDFVAVSSENAARLFGLYPRKGVVAEGSDADLVLFDPDERRVVRSADALSGAGFSVYDGWEVTGWPRVTIRRGEIVLREGRISGTPGSGTVAPRGAWQVPGSPPR